jgi:hypothetical protein
MQMYNLIYHAENGDAYYWNGAGLDKLHKEGEKNLMFSGKPIQNEDLLPALESLKLVINKQFPGDLTPDIEEVKVSVSY